MVSQTVGQTVSQMVSQTVGQTVKPNGWSKRSVVKGS